MSIRERRRERRSLPEAAQHDPPLFLNAKSPIVITHATVSPVGRLKEETAMNAPKQGPVILNERPDDRIDQMLADSTYGPAYLVSVDISRKGGAGNLTPKLRAGIQCPLVQVKNVAQALCELVTGGGQFKIEVFHSMDSTGNKTRLLQPWWEGFTDPPRIGQPYEDLTIAWDDSGGENGAGAWTVVPRAGTNRRNQEQAQYGASPNAYGPPIAGPRIAQAPEFPQPVRGLGGMLLPPPPNLIPPSLRSYPPEQQWQILAGQHERTWGVKPSLEPVDIMRQWNVEKTHDLGDERAAKARLEERHDSLKENSRREVDQANQRLAKLERELAEQKLSHERELERARQQAKDDRIAAEMAALKEKISEKRTEPGASKGIDPAIATIVTTAITQFAAMQTAAAERQQNMLLSLMKPVAPPPPPPSALEQLLPLLTVVIPAVTPIVTQMLANKDPSKLEELESERAMRQLQLGQMLMEQIKSMHPPDEAPPLWYGPVVKIIEGMMGTLQTAALAAGAKNLPALPGPGQQAAQQAPQQQSAPSKRVIVEAQVTQSEGAAAEQHEERRVDEQPIEPQPPNLEMQIDELAKIDPNAASITRLAMRTISAREIDPRLLTPEWTSIVFAVHHRPDLPEEQQQRRFETLVESIVDHLEHCRDFGMLPGPLAKVFEDPESFQQLWSLMPIHMMDREYATALFESLVEEIRDRERERLEPVDAEHDLDDEDEDEDEEEDEDETPATAGGSR